MSLSNRCAVTSAILIDIFHLKTAEESETESSAHENTGSSANEILIEELTQNECQFELLKYFPSSKVGLMEENQTIWLKAEYRREIKEEHYGDIRNTALVLGGFAAIFVLTCFIWTGMTNFRVRRREKQIEKMKLSLVTKL